MQTRYETRAAAEAATEGTQDYYPVFKTSAPHHEGGIPVTTWWEIEYRSESDIQRSVSRWLARQVNKLHDTESSGPYRGTLSDEAVGF